MSTADPIAEIVAYVARTRYQDLPTSVVEVVKKAVVDTAAAAIAGSSAPMGRMVAEMVVDRGGKPESTRWAHGDRLPASEAAFANAIMARWRELDDVHEGTPRLGIGATAGKLLGFDERTVANAMGAAYAHCAGNILSTGDGTRDVWLNAGVGARAGLTAVGRPALGARCLVRERRGREVLGSAWRCRRSRLPATGSLPSSGR